MSRFHNLGANISAAIEAGIDPEDPENPTDPIPDEPEVEPEPDPVAQPEREESMSAETPVEQTDAYKAGFQAASDRMNTVFASEHFAGREAHAAKLLGKSMSAEDIVDILADMPKTQPVDQAAANAAAEEAAREEMREEMGKNATADLGADENADGNKGRAASDAVWDRARAAHSGK